MSTAQQVLMGIITVGLVTTLILPGRQTATVIKAAGSAFSGSLKTAMGR